MAAKTRLDELLVARGLAPSRAQAKALIMSGRVRHGTDRLDKPGKEYPAEFEITVDQPPRFVSRGGEKLAAFLEKFPVDLQGAHILDVGASTGGFTDCALQAGAAPPHASTWDMANCTTRFAAIPVSRTSRKPMPGTSRREPCPGRAMMCW